MKRHNLLATLLLFCTLAGMAQTDTVKPKNVKTGWKLGGVPVVAYNSDVGFKYGGLVNFYYFGDGSLYPNYFHSIYLEWSRTTKGSGINEIMLDSRTLIPKVRTTVDLGYFTEQALDFYGFNGYEANYTNAFENSSDTTDYISRMYYRHERKLLKFTADFQGNLQGEKLRWLGGVGFYGNKINPVDIAKLNEGKEEKDKLPNVASLYEEYVANDIIPDNQTGTQNVGMVKGGVVYDTRDNEALPVKGLWSEGLVVGAFNANYNYAVLSLTHRQYFTLVPNRLSFAYRVIWQTKLAGEIPFYMLPIYYNSKQNRDAFGGGSTIRGVLRNRLVGDGVAMTNLEIRWKALVTTIAKQNFYIALSAFTDAGMVTSPYKYANPNNLTIKAADEKPHIGYGGGVRFALNDNFIIAVDYGMAANKQDGSSGLYIGLNWLF